jgi:hypothetical protein
MDMRISRMWIFSCEKRGVGGGWFHIDSVCVCVCVSLSLHKKYFNFIVNYSGGGGGVL